MKNFVTASLDFILTVLTIAFLCTSLINFCFFSRTQKLVKDKVQKRTRLLPFIQVDRTSNWMNPLVVSNPSMLKKEKAASGSYIRSRGPHFRACRIEGPRGAKKYTTSFCCPSNWIKTPVTCSEELIDLKR